MWFLLLIILLGKIAALWLGSTAPATALALWLVPDALLAYHIFIPRAQGVTRNIRRFATARREVWLTIDDGPDPDDTPRILELLAQHDARATFFVTGENTLAFPHLIRAIHEAGHEVAHHTHTHPAGSFWCASPQRLGWELDAGLAALHAAGITAARFRSPVGIKNLWLSRALRARGLTCIGWSARGLELRGGDAEAIATRVLHRVAPGSILLLHEGPRLPAAIRVAAIRRTLEKLQELGYQSIIPASAQLRIV